MRLIPSDVEYTVADFESWDDRLIRLIRSTSLTWDNLYTPNIGNILRQLIADSAEVLSYYLNRRARESFFPTLQTRQAAILLSRLVNYTPRSAVAARTDLQFTISRAASPGADFVLPVEFAVRTTAVGSPVTYHTLFDVVIPAGETTATVAAENSELVVEVFQSTGEPDQQFTMTRSPFLDGTAVVSAGDGLYDLVDSAGLFLEAAEDDRRCIVEVNESGVATFTFGDGVRGAIPQVGDVEFVYRIGGGAAGTVDAGQLIVVPSQKYVDEAGNAVTLTVTNPSAANPGVDRQSVEEIKREAPLNLQSLNRAVTDEDFENGAIAVAGVARALMLSRDRVPTVPLNSGDLLIVPVGGGASAQALLDAVAAVFATGGRLPKANTFILRVSDAPRKIIDVLTTVRLVNQSQRLATGEAIRANLREYFAADMVDGVDQVDFGYKLEDNVLPFSTIFNVVRDTANVQRIDDGPQGLLLNGARADADVEPGQFPQLGTVTVIDAATGTAI